MYTFEVFGKGAVVAWPGTTSEQAGGERAGKPVRFEAEDAEWVKHKSPLVRRVTRETVRFQGVSYGERLSDSAVRGVYPENTAKAQRNSIRRPLVISPKTSPNAAASFFLGARLRKNFLAANRRLAKPSASKAFRSPSSAPWT